MDLGDIILGDVDLAEVGSDDMPTDIELELATALGSRKEKDTKDTPPSKQKNQRGNREAPTGRLGTHPPSTW